MIDLEQQMHELPAMDVAILILSLASLDISEDEYSTRFCLRSNEIADAAQKEFDRRKIRWTSFDPEDE